LSELALQVSIVEGEAPVAEDGLGQIVVESLKVGCPSIREKALSSETSPGRWVSTAGFVAELAKLRSKTQEISRLISLQWNLLRSTNHRFGQELRP
jgi:hypothetical protein